MPDLKLQYAPLTTLTITSEKGDRVSPSKGIFTSHEGMDFAAADGTNLYNTHDGTVIFSGAISGYGNTLVIQDNETKQSTLYAHLSSIYKSEGSS